MNHIEQFKEGSSVRKLKQITVAALGALALMSALPAMADTLDFDSQIPDIFGGGNTFSEGGYTFLVNDSVEGGVGLAGIMFNGNDPNSCDVAACPVGNPSMYYGGVNDGTVTLSRDGGAFQLNSLKYAFLPPVTGLPAGSYGELTLVGTLAGGGTTSTSIAFPTLVGGYSPFALSALDSGFTSGVYTSVTIGACLFDGGGCSYPSGRQAQFAIDDLDVTAFTVAAPVPEPETYAMMGLGLGMLALARRRHRRAAATTSA
jgi:hypothetical protein